MEHSLCFGAVLLFSMFGAFFGAVAKSYGFRTTAPIARRIPIVFWSLLETVAMHANAKMRVFRSDRSCDTTKTQRKDGVFLCSKSIAAVQPRKYSANSDNARFFSNLVLALGKIQGLINWGTQSVDRR